MKKKIENKKTYSKDIEESLKPLYKRDISSKKMCDEFLTELKDTNKNLQYKTDIYENDKRSVCSIGFRDKELDDVLSKQGLTDTEKMYGTLGTLVVSREKSSSDNVYEANMKVPFILSCHPDTKLTSMKKIGGFWDNDMCKIKAVHVYKESIPITTTSVECSRFNKVKDVIQYINESSKLNRKSAKI